MFSGWWDLFLQVFTYRGKKMLKHSVISHVLVIAFPSLAKADTILFFLSFFRINYFVNTFSDNLRIFLW